jgi:anti-sigma regulatory factor (Ser/Thr protein kinase)
MLLAEELIDDGEASAAGQVADRLAREGVEWDAGNAGGRGTFFQQERAKLQREEALGRITQAESMGFNDVLARIEEASNGHRSPGWRRGSLRKELPRDDAAPALARAAVAVTAVGVPSQQLEDALLLTSEVVTNSVQHPPEGVDFLTLDASVDAGVLRVVVADGGTERIRPRSPGPDGGWGLTIVIETASRWGTGRQNGLNIAWFELDLPAPGA